MDDSTVVVFALVEAIYDYNGPGEGFLSFKRGDVFPIVSQAESGWWEGHMDGVFGWLPSTYVRTLSPAAQRNIDPATIRLSGDVASQLLASLERSQAAAAETERVQQTRLTVAKTIATTTTATAATATGASSPPKAADTPLSRSGGRLGLLSPRRKAAASAAADGAKPKSKMAAFFSKKPRPAPAPGPALSISAPVECRHTAHLSMAQMADEADGILQAAPALGLTATTAQRIAGRPRPLASDAARAPAPVTSSPAIAVPSAAIAVPSASVTSMTSSSPPVSSASAPVSSAATTSASSSPPAAPSSPVSSAAITSSSLPSSYGSTALLPRVSASPVPPTAAVTEPPGDALSGDAVVDSAHSDADDVFVVAAPVAPPLPVALVLAPSPSVAPDSAPADVAVADAEMGSTYRLALYAHAPEGDDELELVTGDVIAVVATHESGWWMGQTTGAMGMFPVGRTRAALPDEVPDALRARLLSLDQIVLQDAPRDEAADDDAERVMAELRAATVTTLTVKVKKGSVRRPAPNGQFFAPPVGSETVP